MAPLRLGDSVCKFTHAIMPAVS